MKASILVPACNVEKYIGQCLDSLLKQTLGDIEIIAVDDGSTDRTGALMDEYAARDKRLRVVHKVNTGYGHSMNVALDLARGEYIGLVESDDFADVAMFERLCAVADRERADVVKSNFYDYRAKLEERSDFHPVVDRRFCGKAFAPTDLDIRDQVTFFGAKPSIWSAVYRRSFLLERGIRFHETPGASYQDTSFAFKVWLTARRVFCVYAAYLYYRQDNEASSVNRPDKVYCVCDEYAEMARFLDADPERARYYPLLNRIRFDTYMWNLDRIDAAFVPAFAKTFADTFVREAEAGRLRKSLFEPWKWDTLKALVDDGDTWVKDFLYRRAHSDLYWHLGQMERRLGELPTSLPAPPAAQSGLKKKARTALWVLRHEGAKGVVRVLREKARS